MTQEQPQNEQLNLVEMVKSGALKLSTPDNPEQQEYQRWKDKTLFSVALVMTVLLIVVIVVISILSLYASNTTPEQKSWALATLSSLMGGAIGFLFGKASN